MKNTTMPLPAAKSSGTRVQKLRKRLGLTQKVFARLLGVTERTAIGIEGGADLSEANARRLTELERLQRDLSRIVSAAAIGPWLVRPNSALDDTTPVDVVASGKIDLLWQMVFELRSGTSS